MNKRLLALAIAVCILAPMTLSARAFDFNLGATAQYQNDVTDDSFEAENLLELDDYRFGAETRLNFIFLEVTDTALFGSTSFDEFDGAIEFTNHLAAGLYKDVADLIRIGVLAGPEFEIKITDEGDVYSGTQNETTGVIDYEAFEFTDIFMKSNFTYKAHVDFLLGKTLTLSATYTLPTDFNLDTMDLGALIPDDDDFKEARVGISLLLF